jgi:hypothetical protein
MLIIDSDNEETWPKTLVTSLNGQASKIRDFHIERRRIESAAQNDVMLRIKPPRDSIKSRGTKRLNSQTQRSGEAACSDFMRRA